MFLLFSHQLTPQQKEDAQGRWGIKEFICLPKEYQLLWSQVPADLPHTDLNSYAQPILQWVKEEAQVGDIVLIQGDYGMVVVSVLAVCQIGLIPVYATTERISKELHLADGSVHLQKIFQHVQFRMYTCTWLMNDSA